MVQRGHRTKPKRFSRKVPGECIQLDTREIAPGIYQYTAVDHCTRLRVLDICSRSAVVTASRYGPAKIWQIFSETRSPAEINSLVEQTVPFHLVNGVLVPR